jgi:hypothetical protein
MSPSPGSLGTYKEVAQAIRDVWPGSPVNEPDPMPWQPAEVIVSLVALQQLAGAIHDAGVSGAVKSWSEGGIRWAIDEFCGTPPHPWPWGPPIRELALAARLAAFAQTVQEAGMRKQLMDIASGVLQRGRG